MVGCSLIAIRLRVLFAARVCVCRLMGAACRLVFGILWSVFGVCCLLVVVCSLLVRWFVVCCSLRNARCSLVVVCCVLAAGWRL